MLTPEQGKRLEDLKAKTEVPVSSHIRRAIEHLLEVPHSREHWRYVGEKDTVKPANIPPDTWIAFKQRLKQTGFDLNQQAQVAVELYLQMVEGKPAPAPDDEARFRRMMEEVAEEKTASLLEQLRAEGKDVKPAVPALMQVTRKVPVTMVANCGPGDGLDNVVEPLENGSMEEITGKLAEKVTTHSFIARASGWSMSSDDSPHDIRPGDLLLMTPLDEFRGTINSGDVVLAEVRFKDGRAVLTLKAYTGKKRLKANNPEFASVDFGPTVDGVRVKAVCMGVLERVFK